MFEAIGEDHNNEEEKTGTMIINDISVKPPINPLLQKKPSTELVKICEIFEKQIKLQKIKIF